jgi:hypothetical protein
MLFDIMEYMYTLFCPIRISLFQTPFLRKYLKGIGVDRDRLCGLVVRGLGYRSGGPGSIPGITRKKCSGSGTGCTQPREYKLRSYLIEK